MPDAFSRNGRNARHPTSKPVCDVHQRSSSPRMDSRKPRTWCSRYQTGRNLFHYHVGEPHHCFSKAMPGRKAPKAPAARGVAAHSWCDRRTDRTFRDGVRRHSATADVITGTGLGGRRSRKSSCRSCRKTPVLSEPGPAIYAGPVGRARGSKRTGARACRRHRLMARCSSTILGNSACHTFRRCT